LELKWSVVALLLSAVPAQAVSFPAFVHGHNICAINVNKFLRKLGHHGTGSASSLSFLRFPRTNHPKLGDVVFNSRGGSKGHVQVYLNNGMCANPSQRHGWQIKPCNATWHSRHKTYLSTR
jgi:hypothetical protein